MQKSIPFFIYMTAVSLTLGQIITEFDITPGKSSKFLSIVQLAKFTHNKCHHPSSFFAISGKL
jgi:hypothetical protein